MFAFFFLAFVHLRTLSLTGVIVSAQAVLLVHLDDIHQFKDVLSQHVLSGHLPCLGMDQWMKFH